jgi:hypothetical protein
MWPLTAIRILLMQISITIQFSVPKRFSRTSRAVVLAQVLLFPHQSVLCFLQPFVFAAQTFYPAVHSIIAQRQAMPYLFQ